MKRVISSSYIRQHPEIKRLNRDIRAQENDLEYLDTCYTLEDVKNHKYESFNMARLIRELETNPEDDPRMIIEDWIDRFDDSLEYKYKEYRESYNALKKFREYVTQLKGVIDIELVDGQWARIPIGGRNPDKLGDLVDLINETLGSKYHGTGRDGSWTAYNIWTPDKVEMKVGRIDEVKDNKDYYGMEVVGIG